MSKINTTYDEGLLQGDNVVAYTDKYKVLIKSIVCRLAFNTLLSSLVCEDFKEVDYDILLNNSIFDETYLTGKWGKICL